MWYVYFEGHDYKYEISELLKLFINIEQICFIDNKALAENQGFLLICRLSLFENYCMITAELFNNEKIIMKKESKKLVINNDDLMNRKIYKRKMKLCIYEIMSEFFNVQPPWGILTGIRPTKIVHELMDQQILLPRIKDILEEEYKISNTKIKLLLNVAKIERPYISSCNEELVSVYISIPFCPSRCLYCSFPSNPLSKGKRNIVTQYLEALMVEIEKTGQLLQRYNKQIVSLYLGGGTPTTLNADELSVLLEHAKKHLDLRDVKEITVEAGRPDTITEEKLNILKNYGVQRISINPQTMNPDTLRIIGRDHSPKDIEDAVSMARKLGFKTINMDLIIGLPDETPSMVENTMKEILRLQPENLTVHTLAIKNSSKLKNEIKNYELAQEEQAKEMLKITANYAEKMGLIPYYMYRQKYMIGNLENIGYCIPKHECIYNIQIMEERQTIIGLGAGAISKVYYPTENRLERVPNVTNVEHYINRVDEMIQKKKHELSKFIE